jgi:ADP-ribose pyrophosphatase YjhB (NUDIX family)
MADEKRGTKQRSGAQLAQQARRELSEITGLEAESVTSLERAEDGSWLVTVELLELSRVPDTDDVIGSYEVELDENGELLGYRRLRRYARSQAGDEQGVQGGK